MSRLWIRLTLALVAVALLCVLIVSLLANATATSQLGTFIDRQRAISQLDLLDALEDHYRNTGSWTDVDTLFAAYRPTFAPQDMRRPGPGGPAGSPPFDPRRGRGPDSLTLADANGTIVFDTLRTRMGTRLPREELNLALPVLVDEKITGYLLVSTPSQLLVLEAQQVFLRQVRRNIVLAAVIGSALAALIGFFISRALSQPLARLANVAHAFSNREWSQRAEVKGTQEIADVARAFNGMAQSLETAEQNRRNLTADIAHELRTPLTVIQGNLRAMLDGVYPIEEKEIATIYDETRLLSRLVDDLRELALAEAGQLALKPGVLHPRDWLRATADQFATAAETRKVRIHITHSDVPAVSADIDRAGQVLRNLLGNALRHTPEQGTVTLSATTQSKFARFEVTDTGDGIPAEDMPHIFDRFYRGDKSRARSSGGSGLGLPISKALIEAMDGKIGASSTPGSGSTFWFTLPLSRLLQN